MNKNFSCQKSGVLFPSILFAIFIVVGCSINETQSLELIVGSWEKVVESLCTIGIYSTFFYCVIVCLFKQLDNMNILEHETNVPNEKVCRGLARRCVDWWFAWFDRTPFWTAFTTLGLSCSFSLIMIYPALFVGDTPWQLGQALGITGFNNHHPLCHTLYIALFLQLGKLIGYNAAIYLSVLCQCVFLWSSIAFFFVLCKKLKIKRNAIFWVVLYFCINPIISRFECAVTKDIIFAGFYVFFCLFFLCGILGVLPFVSHIKMFLLSIVGVVLFRNEGRYILFAIFLFTYFTTSNVSTKKIVRQGSVVILVACAILKFVLFPLLHCESGSIREMLSLPLIQTARYVKFYDKEVTPEERKVISKTIDYKSCFHYTPPMAIDVVKNTWQKNAPLKQYARIWLKMFFKKPRCYIEATLCHTESAFYVSKQYIMWDYGIKYSACSQNKVNKASGLNLAHPKYALKRLPKFWKMYECITEPLNLLLRNLSFYLWWLLLLMSFSIYKGVSIKNLLTIFMPLLMILAVLIASPIVVRYVRYVFTFIITLPIYTIFLLANKHKIKNLNLGNLGSDEVKE